MLNHAAALEFGAPLFLFAASAHANPCGASNPCAPMAPLRIGQPLRSNGQPV
ncbi:MAG: hypothetical protein ACI9MC_000992 [Kiritimatiellia bacterium]|jgi:hypothetical protein